MKRRASARVPPSLRTTTRAVTDPPRGTIEGARVSWTATFVRPEYTIVAVIGSPMAEMSRTRHFVGMGPYAKLLGSVSGPNPPAVAGHGAPPPRRRHPF